MEVVARRNSPPGAFGEVKWALGTREGVAVW